MSVLDKLLDAVKLNDDYDEDDFLDDDILDESDDDFLDDDEEEKPVWIPVRQIRFSFL